jgi:hypothetical protein
MPETKQDKPIDKGMEERFDEILSDKTREEEVYTDAGWGCMECGGGLKEEFVKNFIHQEISQALQRERELWLEKIDLRMCYLGKTNDAKLAIKSIERIIYSVNEPVPPSLAEILGRLRALQEVKEIIK